MTLYQFIAADEMEQAETVWDGILIADREDTDHRILLYQINSNESFYVEVYYHKEHNVIKKFRPFKSTDLLIELYGDQIDLVKLLYS